LRQRLDVAARARRQIEQASEWWFENRPAARGLFREELKRGFEIITTQPGIGASALDSGLTGVRRLHLSRIRYHLYYRFTAEAVEVLALWHTSRGTGPSL